MSRRALGLVLVLVATVLVAAPVAVRAATTHFVDDAVDCDPSGTPYYCTIQTAVNAAASGDTIEVAAGTYQDVAAAVVLINGKDLTIIGAGKDVTVIDAQDARQGVTVSSATVSLSDLSIWNGSIAGTGANASVSGAGAHLGLTDVVLRGGSADSGGGLFVGNGASADLLRVDLNNNSASAGIGVGGGGAIFTATASTAALTITDSTFSLNTSIGHGGAIQGFNAGGVSITGSSFIDNSTSTGSGGAVSFHAVGGTFTVTDTTFYSNDALLGGGAVAVGDGTHVISGSLFHGNSTPGAGGGLFTSTNPGSLLVKNSTFFDNEATGDGGGARVSGGFFVNTTFAQNSTGDEGGGLAHVGNLTHVANSIFAGNTSVASGPDCFQITSEGHNLIADATGCVLGGDTVGNVTGQNPLLMPLADNGGPTMTMALAVGSPAHHAGNPDPADPTDWDAADDAGDGDWSCAPTDQRGDARSDVRCDIGAFELGRVVRYAGANRYDTAATTSEGDFTDPATVTTVFIATGSNFPDGLAGAAAAAKTGGPLLLVDSGVPAETAAELTRLAPDEIVILGGTGAVSDPVKDALEVYAQVTRVFGATRYLTAIAISQWAFPVDGTADVVFVATGVNFPDALAAGAAAGALNGPVLLVPGDEADLPAEVGAEILRLDPATIVVVGGTGAVSDGIYQDLEDLQLSDTVTRIFGADRYVTAAAISAYAFAADLDRFYVATGFNFPDALAGSGAAGWWDGPVLLVPGTSIPAEVVTEVNRLTLPNSTTGIILGGTGVVGPTVESDLVSLLGP